MVSVVSPVGRRGLGILAVGALIGGVLTTGTMNATEVAASSTLVVDSVADTVDPGDGVLTLREAITTANTRNGTTISFSLPDPATITLTSSLPEIKKPVTISGPGEASLTIDSATFRPFYINGGNTTITDLSLTGAPAAIPYFGSLIHNTKATTILQRITMENVTMTGSAWGTLIYNKESNSFLTIQDSTFSGNSADDSSYLIQANHGSTDSGVPADNVVSIEGSTFVDNEDFVVLQAQRTMLVSDSTFLRNYQAVSFIGAGDHVFDNNRVEANSQGAQINPWKNDARGWFFHNTVTDNQFINNDGFGLSSSVVAPASATITGNTFAGNSPDLLYNGSSTVPAGIASTNTFTSSPSAPAVPEPPAVPDPPLPASAPVEVSATPGDGSAQVAWSAPVRSGSFPISHYQVSTLPRGGACLVSAETTGCSLEGLSNGSEYEVRVRALTGAGWGSWSDAVSVTPVAVPAIVVTGSRTGRMVSVVGEVSGMSSGSVSVWVRWPGQARYAVAESVRVTRGRQDVTWQRRTNKRVYVFFQAVGDDGQKARSHRIIIPR